MNANRDLNRTASKHILFLLFTSDDSNPGYIIIDSYNTYITTKFIDTYP